MQNTTHSQVDLAFQAARHLSVSFQAYRNARWAWARYQDSYVRNPHETLEQYQVRKDHENVLFNRTYSAMKTTRRLHDEYMAVESKLNQMGGMKR